MVTYTNNRRSLNFLLLSFYAFLGFFIDLLLGWFIEPMIYGTKALSFTDIQSIFHFLIVSLLWLTIAVLLICFSKKKLNFNVF